LRSALAHGLAQGPSRHSSRPSRAAIEAGCTSAILIDLCADLGPAGVMVFGSPPPAHTTGGLTRQQATRNYVEGLCRSRLTRPIAELPFLIEALPIGPVRRSAEPSREAVSLVKSRQPAIRTMLRPPINAVDRNSTARCTPRSATSIFRHVSCNELRWPACWPAPITIFRAEF